MSMYYKIVLFQVLIVLFPIFVYHLFFHESDRERRKPYSKLSILLIIILIFSMSFPIEFTEGYIYDFRVIPIIISFVYGGLIPGLITGAVLIIYRFIIGGDGFNVALVDFSLTCVLLIYMEYKLKFFQKKNKILFTSIVFWVNTFIVMLTLFTKDQSSQLSFVFIYYTITWICMMMVVFVIENVNQQMAIREKLKQDEKLNVVSQLAASVAHEVRNPLTSVRGFLQLISEDDNLRESQKAYIKIAVNELDHAQSIINDYLSLAKPHTEEMSSINISEEVMKTVALMTSYSNIQNITIETDIQDSLFIKGNKGEIKQVLVNIMKNGIESMNIGGILKVRTFERIGLIFIEIIDSGKGMTKQQLKNLGTPFYTTKEKGTGVGLTISFQLVHAMKGKITVQSQPEKGTNFTIQFPSA
ncbi:ATP-binding protein [Neobacillus kokaensis]|uniref:histidine kinase n=1 Tax=Neobacillus kokaensis TaxID=2759023 RepID=A0ABQ3N9C1_9BACI|nr:ATP-binding protein [Neobacillus kokaensis]GHI00288.1 two-component sensor histidine kinase [Neobacillus kokaensis]